MNAISLAEQIFIVGKLENEVDYYVYLINTLKVNIKRRNNNE